MEASGVLSVTLDSCCLAVLLPSGLCMAAVTSWQLWMGVVISWWAPDGPPDVFNNGLGLGRGADYVGLGFGEQAPWGETHSDPPPFFFSNGPTTKCRGLQGQVQANYRFRQCLGEHTGISSWLFPHGFPMEVGISWCGSPICWSPNAPLGIWVRGGGGIFHNVESNASLGRLHLKNKLCRITLVSVWYRSRRARCVFSLCAPLGRILFVGVACSVHGCSAFPLVVSVVVCGIVPTVEAQRVFGLFVLAVHHVFRACVCGVCRVTQALLSVLQLLAWCMWSFSWLVVTVLYAYFVCEACEYAAFTCPLCSIVSSSKRAYEKVFAIVWRWFLARSMRMQ